MRKNWFASIALILAWLVAAAPALAVPWRFDWGVSSTSESPYIDVTSPVYGAKGDNVTDDTAALQSAFDNAVSTGNPVWIPNGKYRVSAPLNVTGKIVVMGAGKNRSYITAADNATISALIQLPPAIADVNDTSRSQFIGFSLSGNSGAADFGIQGTTNHAIFRDLLVVGTDNAAIDITYGACNLFENVELSSNTGDGLRLGVMSGGMANAAVISACKIFNNSGTGVTIASTYTADIHGCTIESNKIAGVFIGASQGINLGGNYFEANAETGNVFTTPSATIKADIILNGGTSKATMAFASPSSAYIVGNNTTTAYADSFIYAPGATYGLTVTGNSVFQNGTTPVLVGNYGSTTVVPSYSRLDNVHVGINRLPNGTFGFDHLDNTVINYATAPRVYSLIADQRNYADTDLNGWDNATAIPAGVTWARSDNVYSRADIPVWSITDNQSRTTPIFGFTVDAAAHPENIGKYFVFGFDARHYYPTTGNIVAVANGVAMNTSYAADNTAWVNRSALFLWPASGTMQFGVRKIGAAGTVHIAAPTLMELGAGISAIRAAIVPQTVWHAAAAPTAGTWKVGDIVYNTGTDNVIGWKCTAAPTTFNAMSVTLAP